MTIRNAMTRSAALLFALLSSAATPAFAQPNTDRAPGHWMVGTWYLALDTTIFGLPPGHPFSAIAIFHDDGTFQIQDAGDFGQATFLNTRQQQQFGSWRHGPKGTVLTTALFLEADLQTGEVLRWHRTVGVFSRADKLNEITGIMSDFSLECDNLLPLPTAVTCPDPIESADEFVLVPPPEMTVILKRLVPGDQ